MVHSTLTSRVILHIRAQAGDNPVSDGVTDLNTIRFHDSDVDSSGIVDPKTAASKMTNISPA
jgi:hypothetical protein